MYSTIVYVHYTYIYHTHTFTSSSYFKAYQLHTSHSTIYPHSSQNSPACNSKSFRRRAIRVSGAWRSRRARSNGSRRRFWRHGRGRSRYDILKISFEIEIVEIAQMMMMYCYSLLLLLSLKLFDPSFFAYKYLALLWSKM